METKTKLTLPSETISNLSFTSKSLDNISINNYQMDDGLSANLSTKVLVDKEGFVWIGTEDGLNRYDGKSFNKYKTDPDRSDSLNNNQITTIFEDSKGYLWIGTYGSGLELFDKNSNRFRHFKHDSNWDNTIAGDYIVSVNQDSNGLIWVGTEDHGLSSYNMDKNLWNNYTASSESVLSIIEDSKKRLWIGTKSGLSLFNREKNEFQNILNGYQVNDIKYYNNDLWIATENNGLLKFSTLDMQIKSYYIEDRSIISLFIDSVELLWIGTESGIKVLNVKNGDFVPLRYNFDSPVYSIDEDMASGIWLSSNSGIFRIERRTTSFNSYMDFKSISCITKDHLSNIWVANSSGEINIYNSKLKEWNLWDNQISNREILSLHFTKDSDLWVGTDRGLLMYSSLSHDSKPIFYLDNYIINSITSDVGVVWIGTENGLFYFDKEIDDFIEINLEHNKVNTVFIDSIGNIWIGTKGGGILLYNRSKKSLKKVVIDSRLNKNMNSNNILTFYEDRSGIIWIGTRGGLIRFNNTTQIFKRYSESSGLPNNIVKAVLEDDKGYLWISTNKGLSKFNPKNEEFVNFNKFDGLSGDIYNVNSAIYSDTGIMFFGAESGVSSFYPDDNFRNSYIPSIYFTSFTQSGIPLVFNEAIENLETITLKWPKNSIEFSFAALNFYQSNHNYYAYKLEGYDNFWNYTNSIGSGQYSNLPGGRYKLRVKGSNNDGVWNNTGTFINLIIYPAFWKTWWFRGLLIILLLFLIILIFRLKVQSTHNKAIELENEVKKQTNKRVLIENELAVISERTRLARDLHDSVTQTLFSANLISEVLPELWNKNPNKAATKTRLVNTLTSGALAEMRTLLRELKPSSITEVPMSDLLNQLIIISKAQSGINISIKTEENITLKPDIQIVFYRVAQEALNNIVKHSCGSKASVIFKSDKKETFLRIDDNGCGFDTSTIPPGHFGIGNMKGRAMDEGISFKINSSVDCGTIIELKWRGKDI
ncbi:MAG: histidine kinase [Spirochaetaceae bacterium]